MENTQREKLLIICWWACVQPLQPKIQCTYIHSLSTKQVGNKYNFEMSKKVAVEKIILTRLWNSQKCLPGKRSKVRGHYRSISWGVRLCSAKGSCILLIWLWLLLSAFQICQEGFKRLSERIQSVHWRGEKFKGVWAATKDAKNMQASYYTVVGL